MKITGLNHANITVPCGAEDEARRFYCQLLGLTEVGKPDALKLNGGLWVMAGTMPVHIGVEDGVLRHKTKVHLAYEVDDLASWQAHLQQAGIEAQPNTPFPGYVRIMLRDPFGTRVELIQATG